MLLHIWCALCWGWSLSLDALILSLMPMTVQYNFTLIFMEQNIAGIPTHFWAKKGCHPFSLIFSNILIGWNLVRFEDSAWRAAEATWALVWRTAKLTSRGKHFHFLCFSSSALSFIYALLFLYTHIFICIFTFTCTFCTLTFPFTFAHSIALSFSLFN